MKRLLFFAAALLMTVVTASAQTIVKGDMNDDGLVNIADVTSVVNVAVGRTPMTTIDVSSSPFTVDNSLVVGTWYKSDGSHFTLGEDGTTDFPNSATYKYMPMLGRMLFYGANEKATTIVGLAEITDDYLLILDYTTGALTYYTKSTSLCQITGVTLSQTSLSMNSGTTSQLSATVAPSSAFNQAVTWSSSNESVATVDQNGLVTAVAGGSCTITATSADGSGKTAQCAVTVTQMVTSIVLSQTAVVLELDEFVRLTATVLPENAANKAVVWSSSNEDVATVRSGRVDAYGYGAATITCTAADGSGVFATCIVKIVEDKSTVGTENGHFYIDLGLPSGTLWAETNIGAENPEDYGDYFAWGETEGYNSGKTTFDWSTYKYCNGSSSTLTKYCTSSDYGTVDNKTDLVLEDDAAYVNWGSQWRMPSKSQFDELINSNYTTTEWTTQNSVYGRKITSKTNGNSIFLPAAGCRIGSSLYYGGSYGNYWSRTLNASDTSYAYILNFGSGGIAANYRYRYSGPSVRPVRLLEQ